MVVFLQNNLIWNKFKYNEPLKYEELESYIYSKKYLSLSTPTDCRDMDDIYNSELHKYFFEVEEYDNEESYEEIFFQNYIDGELEWQDYIRHEKKFTALIETLFDTGDTYVCFHLFIKLEDSYPFKKCTDITVDTMFIHDNADKFIRIEDKEILKQISILSAREILNVDYIFTGIKSVLINSGMHGYLLSENALESKLKNKIQAILE